MSEATTMANGCWVIDTCALINCFAALALAECHVIQRAFVPERVLDEIRRLAVSNGRAPEGRRGLMAFVELWRTLGMALEPLPRWPEPQKLDVDGELVEWALKLQAGLLTGDGDLVTRARARGVLVLDLRDFERATAYRPLLPGDEIPVAITDHGYQDGQGVGYLPDRTRVVVNRGASHLGEELRVVVTYSLRPDKRRIVFGDPLEGAAGFSEHA